MTPDERRLREAFAVSLNMSEGDVSEALTYTKSSGWDSLAHMTLMAVLEETFSITLEPDEMVAMLTYAKAREILSRHGVSF